MRDPLADHLAKAWVELQLHKQQLLRALVPDRPLVVGPRQTQPIDHQLPLFRKQRRRRLAVPRPIASLSRVRSAQRRQAILGRNRGLGAATDQRVVTVQRVVTAQQIASGRRAGSVRQAANAQRA